MAAVLRNISGDRAFRILGFTDTHIDGNESCGKWTMRLIRETVLAEKPDMVVFVGDNVTGADNLGRAQVFSNMMTELGVPWCPVLGNHEGDNPGSIGRGEMMEIFRESPCCCIPADAAVHECGRLDYAVPLKDEKGGVRFAMFFMDGGAYMSEEECRCYGCAEESYACLNRDQIEWYREISGRYECGSMVFCHIPLPEFKTAEKEGELIAGANREGVCCPPYNSGMFAAMEDIGKTVAFVSGHDHINDSHMMYRGVRLVYNRMSGLSSYNVISKGLSDRLIQGCSVYDVYADGHVEYGDILYEDRYGGYRDEILKVIRK